MTLPVHVWRPSVTMSDCRFATGWVKAVADPTGTRGSSLPDGPAFHDSVAATATA